MARRFRGDGLHKVDAKGRVSIPAGFRRVLEANDPSWTEGLNPEMVIVFGDESRNFLECYTMKSIDEVDDMIEAMDRGSDERDYLEEMFNGLAINTTLDDTGRLVLPARCRQKLDLEGEAYFIASGDTFRIWKPETYQEESVRKRQRVRDRLGDGQDPLVLLKKARSE